MYNRFISILALSLALIVPATGAFADAPKKTVRIASGMSHDPHHIGLMEFLIPWFEEKLGDKYEFEVYPDNGAGELFRRFSEHGDGFHPVQRQHHSVVFPVCA